MIFHSHRRKHMSTTIKFENLTSSTAGLYNLSKKGVEQFVSNLSEGSQTSKDTKPGTTWKVKVSGKEFTATAKSGTNSYKIHSDHLEEVPTSDSTVDPTRGIDHV
jgi:hypothetical protein